MGVKLLNLTQEFTNANRVHLFLFVMFIIRTIFTPVTVAEWQFATRGQTGVEIIWSVWNLAAAGKVPGDIAATNVEVMHLSDKDTRKLDKICSSVGGETVKRAEGDNI